MQAAPREHKQAALFQPPVCVEPHRLAEVYDHRGDIARAKACDEAHLDLQRQLGDPHGVDKALSGVAISWLREGAFERVEAAVAEAVESFQFMDGITARGTGADARARNAGPPD